MGMDVYGNPAVIVGTEPKFPDNYRDLTEAEQDEYWAASNKYQKDNPGVYFRANVWSWRPIHMFMSEPCSDIYGEDLDESMSYNNGKGIPKDLVEECADAMQQTLDSIKETVPQYIEVVDGVELLKPVENPEWKDWYAVPLTRLQDWVDFVRHSNGFEVH